MPVLRQHKPDTFRDTQQRVHLFGALIVAPALPVIGVAPAVFQISTPADKQKRPGRRKRHYFVMVVLKARTRGVRVQQAQYGVFLVGISV